MQHELLIATVDRLIGEGKQVLTTVFDAGDPRLDYIGGRPRGVDLQSFAKWQAGCQNLVRMLGAAADPWAVNFTGKVNQPGAAKRMVGTLEAIREAITHGLLVRVEDLIRAETFDSLLEQADYLLSEGYFLAAAVLGRAVMEEHLRGWCDLKGCTPPKAKPTINDYKDSLYKSKLLNVTQMKHVEALAAVGNDAAQTRARSARKTLPGCCGTSGNS